MQQSYWDYLTGEWVSFWGRRRGSSEVEFDPRTLSVFGRQFQISFLLGADYINLPPNAYGILVHPDGTNHRVNGGIQRLPSGQYTLYYVDNHNRANDIDLISEMTQDGEKISLRICIHYRVIDPLILTEIKDPVETLLTTISADVLQYIRTRNRSEIADSAQEKNGGQLFRFILERHNGRFPLSRAFILTGLELKEFIGDQTFVAMRRDARVDEMKNQLEKARTEYHQELERMGIKHKTEMEKNAAAHEKEKQDILQQVRLRDIQLDDARKRSQRRHDRMSQAVEAITRAMEPSGYPRNANEIKAIATELLTAMKDETAEEINPIPDVAEKAAQATQQKQTNGDKVEKLTNRLLSLLGGHPTDSAGQG